MKRTPLPRPLTTDSYPGWTVDFTWKPAKVLPACSGQDYCDGALNSIVSTCSGSLLADAYSSGTISDDCGQFTYTVDGYPDPNFHGADVTCDLPAVNDISSDHIPRAWPRDAYRAAAHQFCYGGYHWDADPQETKSWTATDYFWFDTGNYDNTTNLPTYCIGAAIATQAQTNDSSAGTCKSGPGLRGSNSKAWVQVVPSPSQDGCKALSKYKLPAGEDCVKKMMHVIDKCMPDNSGKVGVWKQDTPYGCWDWWLWGRVLT